MAKKSQTIDSKDRIAVLENQLGELLSLEYEHRQNHLLLELQIKRLIPQLREKVFELEVVKNEKAILTHQLKSMQYSRGWKTLELLDEIRKTKKIWKIIKILSMKREIEKYDSITDRSPESALTSFDWVDDSAREKKWHPLYYYNDREFNISGIELSPGIQLKPIQDGYPYFFTLNCASETIDRISLYCGSFKRATMNRLILKVWDGSIPDQPVRVVEKKKLIVINNEFIEFSFEPINNAKDKEFFVSVESPGANYGNCIGIFEKRKTSSYLEWCTRQEITPDDIIQIRQEIKNFSQKALISLILPIHKGDADRVQKTLMSIKEQIYQNWELCIIVEDPVDQLNIAERANEISDLASRVNIKLSSETDSFSNAVVKGFFVAKGEFIGVLWNNDLLAPNALFEIVKLLDQHPEAEFIYTDEDEIRQDGIRSNPHFKPQWSPDLLLSSMYIGSAFFFKKSLSTNLRKLNGLTIASQKYDLVLKLTEATQQIYRIPKILYHNLKLADQNRETLIAEKHNAEHSKEVLEIALERRNIDGIVTAGLFPDSFRVKRPIENNPRISIIIPSGGNQFVLQRCVDSILSKTGYRNFEIIVVDNSQNEGTENKYIAYLEKKNCAKIIPYKKPFNFSAINNYAVKFTDGEHLLFLNDDTEIIDSDWLESLLEHSQRAEVGAVGCKLLYFDHRIQHAGIILGIGGTAGHSHKYVADQNSGTFFRKDLILNVSGVTAACLMTKKWLFQEIGGFDEKNFAVAYNDVDFNLRLRRAGFLVVYTPWARLYHHEAFSRSFIDGMTSRHKEEAKALISKWGPTIKDDPYYNPNLSIVSEDFSLREEDEDSDIEKLINQDLM